MKSKLNLPDVYPWLIFIGGVLGLIASLILVHDTLAIAQNTHYVPSCNLNPIISCGDVITFKGDSIFGLPYSFYGVAAFGMLVAAGAGMIAKANFEKWYWAILQLATTIGLISAYYLLFKSIYDIHALCPFCLSIDVITTTIFWYTTLRNIDRGMFAKIELIKQKPYAFVRRHHLDILLLWFMLVVIFILHHFWYYYGKHL